AFPFDQSLSVLVLTHLLPDRPTFLAALGKIVAISRIVAIPYSINRDVQNTVAKSYRVDLFTLEEMEVGEVLIEAFSQDMQKLKSPMAIMEIGGYYARFGNRLRTTYGERFWGAVEDTEGGHRRYEKEGHLTFPVVSVARSSLKRVEDALIGPSVMFSVERF